MKRTALHIFAREYCRPEHNPQNVLATLDVLLDEPSCSLEACDQQGYPAIFPLLSRAESAPTLFAPILKKLIESGLDLEVRDSDTLATPLDQAMRSNQPNLFIQLVNFGAGRYAKPEEVFAFTTKHHKLPGMAQAIQTLEAQFPRLAFFNTLLALSDLTLQKGGLTLTGARSKALHLKPSVMKQVPLHKTTGRITRLSGPEIWSPRRRRPYPGATLASSQSAPRDGRH